METFDFEHYTLVGYVDIQSSSNAYIEPLGYVNIHNDLRIISPKEKKKMFPPKGRVFGRTGNFPWIAPAPLTKYLSTTFRI